MDATLPRIDRYLLSQFLQLFGFFALVLVGVYWINKAVDLFDQLISDGQSALVFLEFSLLTLPSVIKLVLPIAAFVATVYGTNRLILESELVVMQATGFSNYRLARPVLYFGVIVGLMMSVMGHVLVPASRAALVSARATMSENITARYLTPGQFAHPSSDVTVYLHDISPKGELLDLFLADDRTQGVSTIYTAKRALFVRGDAGPKLIMFDGMAQVLNGDSHLLSVTRFVDFTFDLGAMLTAAVRPNRSMAELSTAELLWPTEALAVETGESQGRLRYEGHNRFAEPLLAVAVTLVGFASLLVGGFSRFGLWRQIAMAVALLIVVQGLSTNTANLAERGTAGWAQRWVLAYLAPAVGLAMAYGLLWWAGRSRSNIQRASASPGPMGAAA